MRRVGGLQLAHLLKRGGELGLDEAGGLVNELVRTVAARGRRRRLLQLLVDELLLNLGERSRRAELRREDTAHLLAAPRRLAPLRLERLLLGREPPHARLVRRQLRLQLRHLLARLRGARGLGGVPPHLRLRLLEGGKLRLER